MSSLFVSMTRSWRPAFIFFCLLLLQGHTAFAADSYHVCTRTPHNDLTFLEQADGTIRYTFSGNLKCHVHYNYDAFHSLPHDSDDEYGDYRVTAGFKGNRLQEQIWINMPHHYGGSPAIDTHYSCQADPFQSTAHHCKKIQRTTPNHTQWQGAVEEAAGFTVPLSVGLASKGMLEKLYGVPNGPYEPPAGQAGNTPSSLVTDITFLKEQFSGIARQYFFSFVTPLPGRYEKLEAIATKPISSQTVDISIRGAGHHIDLTYKCNNIMDPFLDPGNKCAFAGSSSPADSLRQALEKQKYPLVFLFSDAISNARRKQLRWKALAKSMRPKIIANGKTIAQDTGYQTIPGASTESSPSVKSTTKIMLSVESARDIRRNGEYPVEFHIRPAIGKTVHDIHGNVIAMPLVGKYTGNAYNTTAKSISNLAPGEYLLYASGMTSITQRVKTAEIPFTVTSHVSPKKEPVIVEPQENQQFKKGSEIAIKVLVAKPMFGTGFDANIEIEHSRLASQESYKPYWTTEIKNTDKKSMIVIETNVAPLTGDFRIRAKMVYDGKPTGEWSPWRHFHVGGKSIFHLHRGLSILSPKQDQTYTNTIPVKISLPETMKKEGDLTLTWAMVGNSAARELLRKTVTVKPETTFETKQDVAELLAKNDGEAGDLQLSVALADSNKHDSVQFNVGMLGTPAQQGGNKMSGKLILDTPIFTAPGENQIFMAPANVKVEMVHKPEIKISTELEYCPFPTSKTAIINYQPISIKPADSHKEKGKTTLTYQLAKPGLYQIRACNNDKVSLWSQWRRFKVDTVSSGLISTVKNPGPAQFDKPAAPKILAPKNHATFTPAQPIVIRVQNGPPKKYLTFEIEKKSSGQNGQYKRDDLRRDMKASDKEFVEDISVGIWGNDEKLRPGAYRVRVGLTYNPYSRLDADLNWSEWLYFRVLPALHTVPHLIEQKNILPGGKITKGQPTTKMITPQPKLPGKQLRALNTRLRVLPLGRTFQAPATVTLQVQNTPYKRLPFEVRFRPGTSGPYKVIPHPGHTFARRGKLTVLTLKLTRPGHYQVRFKANHKAPWTPWQSFQVLNKKQGPAILARNMRMTRSTGNSGISPGRETQDRLGLAHQLKPGPPRVESPKNGQKFMLTGNRLTIRARISHGPNVTIRAQVEQKVKGRYVPLKAKPVIRAGKTATTVEIPVTATGDYRLRVRAGDKGGKWSGWTNFTVDRLMRKPPKLEVKKPSLTTRPAKPAGSGALQINPGMTHLR